MNEQAATRPDQKSEATPRPLFRPGGLALVNFPVVEDELEALLGPSARRHAPCVAAGCIMYRGNH